MAGRMTELQSGGTNREKPMLASASTGSSGRAPINVATLVGTGGWILDTKLDGIRAFARGGRLLNRRGVDITAKFPEVSVDPGAWFDGEIMARDNLFETVAWRDKLERRSQIAQAAESNPCVFVAFDLPEQAHKPWIERRAILTEISNIIGLPITPISHDVSYLDLTREAGMEGVIAKRIESRYQFGRRSPDWVKHKFTQRISCLVRGYEPGQGSRAHMGALILALIGDGEIVNVGRCGSGFTERQTHELKARIDAGEVLVAEIEALNLTSGNTLRFPVFRGLRSDVDPHDCTTAQLSLLNRSGKPA